MFNSYAVSGIKKVLLALLVIVMMGLLLNRNAIAQTAQLDVDRLYARYKGQTETTIFAGEQEISAHVLINYNSNNQPYRIIIYGEATADKDVEKLVDQLCGAKLKAGYLKQTGPGVVNFDYSGMYENNIAVKAYQKGTQYAKYGIKNMEARNQVAADSVAENVNYRHANDFFYFEVGDNARMKTRKPEKFNF